MAPHRRKSGLIIPSNVASVKPPKYACTVCREATFTEDEQRAYQQHVVACAKRNEQALRENSPREKAPGIFGDQGLDVELRDWARKHADEIIHGSLKM